MAPLDTWLARRRILWLVLAVALGAASHAQAQCHISVDAAVTFGSYNVFSTADLDTAGQISWRCQGNAATSVQITITRGASGDSTSRRLARSSEFLRYDLYRDAARTVVWGDGTYGGFYSGTFAGGGWVPIPIYARVPRSQDVAAGTYSDAVTVVVNF